MALFLFIQFYEPVEEGSYIKMIDMVSGHGGQIQVNSLCFVIADHSVHCLIYLFYK